MLQYRTDTEGDTYCIEDVDVVVLAAAGWCPHLAEVAGVGAHRVPVIPVIGNQNVTTQLR